MFSLLSIPVHLYNHRASTTWIFVTFWVAFFFFFNLSQIVLLETRCTFGLTNMIVVLLATCGPLYEMFSWVLNSDKMLLALMDAFHGLSELNGKDSLSGSFNAFPYGGSALLCTTWSLISFQFWNFLPFGLYSFIIFLLFFKNYFSFF